MPWVRPGGEKRPLSAFPGDGGKVMTLLKRVVHVLNALSTSTMLGEGIGLVRRMAFLDTVLPVPDARSIVIPPCETDIRSRWYPTRCLFFLVPNPRSF